MDLRPINANYSVTGQVSVEDLPGIKAAGFKSIVCHRPDGEAADQPDFESIRQAAETLGIEARQIPVGPMGVTADAVRAMVDAIEEMPSPMLGYCRSGARSTAIYQHTAHMRN
tara:strand:- start:5678 stop:6016 length:339 start_codon:yes stop_codon:yes gene_type:complete